jgi:hypothetical protein
MIITERDLLGAKVAVVIELQDGRSLRVDGEYRKGLIRPDPSTPNPDTFPVFDVRRTYEQYRPIELETRVIVDLTLKLDRVSIEHGTVGGTYTGEPCPNCGRARMLKLGVCDKCYWDVTTGTYATDARSRQADTGRAEP